MPTHSNFTPKQVAQALGVSESSIKRWVDSGKVEAIRTAGGHRKLTLSAVVQLAREQGYHIVRPDVLGLAVESTKFKLRDACKPLIESLAVGDEAASQAIIESLYHAGHTMVEIADDVIAPVFHEVGNRWERGELDVHQERRACEIAVATLHNIRRMLPVPSGDAPRSIAVTPAGDQSELPVRLAELVLREKGWNAKVLGIALPLDEIRKAIKSDPPNLALLSATHLTDVERFVSQANVKLLEPTRDVTRWVVGGQAFPAVLQPSIECYRFSKSMADLAVVSDDYLTEFAEHPEAR